MSLTIGQALQDVVELASRVLVEIEQRRDRRDRLWFGTDAGQILFAEVSTIASRARRASAPIHRRRVVRPCSPMNDSMLVP